MIEGGVRVCNADVHVPSTQLFVVEDLFLN